MPCKSLIFEVVLARDVSSANYRIISNNYRFYRWHIIKIASPGPEHWGIPGVKFLNRGQIFVICCFNLHQLRSWLSIPHWWNLDSSPLSSIKCRDRLQQFTYVCCLESNNWTIWRYRYINLLTVDLSAARRPVSSS